MNLLLRETLDGSLLVAYETVQFPGIVTKKRDVIACSISSIGSIHLAFYILLKQSLDSTPHNFKMVVG